MIVKAKIIRKMSDMNEVDEKIQAALLAKEHQGYEASLRLLEEAHILAQPDAGLHFHVHWKMFLLAFEFGNRKEFIGQIPRILLALPGSLLGMAPKGNVGSTKMGIFEKRK